MKNRIFYIVVAGLFAVALVFGVFYRFSYTDITAEENYLDKLQVGELPEDICLYTCQSMEQNLPNTPNILRVTPLSELENQFGRSCQKVVVRQVFAGDELSVGDEIQLTCDRWKVIIREDGWSVERGFVNILREDSDYLVFLLNNSGAESEGLPVYFLNMVEDGFIAPVFCYGDIANAIVLPTGRDTYVPYTQVKDNEFFAASQAGLDAWCALKQKMIESYPAS